MVSILWRGLSATSADGEHELDLPEFVAVPPPDAAPERLPVQQYVSLGLGQQAGHNPREGGLAAPRLADNPHRLPALHGQVDLSKRLDRHGAVHAPAVSRADVP